LASATEPAAGRLPALGWPLSVLAVPLAGALVVVVVLGPVLSPVLGAVLGAGLGVLLGEAVAAWVVVAEAPPLELVLGSGEPAAGSARAPVAGR
jgi:hypothetical protein